MLNWEMEIKKWAPAFKVLTYYGTQKERRFKRVGWTKPNAFHICITSYKLVTQDHSSFRRKVSGFLIVLTYLILRKEMVRTVYCVRKRRRGRAWLQLRLDSFGEILISKI